MHKAALRANWPSKNFAFNWPSPLSVHNSLGPIIWGNIKVTLQSRQQPRHADFRRALICGNSSVKFALFPVAPCTYVTRGVVNDRKKLAFCLHPAQSAMWTVELVSVASFLSFFEGFFAVHSSRCIWRQGKRKWDKAGDEGRHKAQVLNRKASDWKSNYACAVFLQLVNLPRTTSRERLASPPRRRLFLRSTFLIDSRRRK